MKNMYDNLEITLSTFITKDTKLNADFVTGLTEAEGSFSITKHKETKAQDKVNIGLRFKLTMLSNEIDLLQGVKLFFLIADLLQLIRMEVFIFLSEILSL